MEELDKICLPDQNMRNFYRQCKEDLEFYLNSVQKEDYHFIYKLVGPPSNKPFVQLEGPMAEDLMRHLWLYFSQKMKRL